jgi:uncharacterized protein YbcI
MSESQHGARPQSLAEVSNAVVALHKTQFGRGPTTARSHFAGPDVLVCVLEDALLPAEVALVELGEQQRVREARTFFQAATARSFIEAVESITGRTVRAFSSATDPDAAIVCELFVFEREEPGDENGRFAAPSARHEDGD